MTKYILKNIKLIFHLFFRTYHFGTNNKFYKKERSIFGKNIFFSIVHLKQNYKMMKVRSFLGFIPLKFAKKLFPKYAKKHKY